LFIREVRGLDEFSANKCRWAEGLDSTFVEVGINEHIPVKSFTLDDESTAPQCNKV